MCSNPDPTRREKFWPLLIISAVAVIFLPVCWQPFAGFDDSMCLYWNPHMGRPLLQNIGWYWTHPFMHLYTPFVFSIWNILAAIAKLDVSKPPHFSLNAHVFHAASLVVHTATTLLVFVILRRLVKIDIAAAIGALLFGLHPLQVESVAWASGLKDLLCTHFCLLCLWQYLCAVEAKAGKWHYASALIALTLALLSKPAAVMMPALVAVVDFFMVQRSPRRIAVSILPFLVVAGIAAIIGRAVQPPSHQMGFPLFYKPLIVLDSLAFYLRKIVMPWDLAVAYGRNPSSVIESGALLWTCAIPIAAGIAIYAFRKNRPWLTTAALFFVLAPLPVLGWTTFDFQRISTVADHYLNLAMFGPALFAAGFIAGVVQRGPQVNQMVSRFYPRIAFALLVILAADTCIQRHNWRNNVSVWQHAVAIAPNCAAAHENLGFAYLDLGPKYNNEQVQQFAEAVRLHPDDVREHDLLSSALIAVGRVDEAIAEMKLSIHLQERRDRPGAKLPDSRLAAYISVGDLLLAKDRPDEAAEMFRKILRQLPHDPTARQHLELCVYRLPKQLDAKPILLGAAAD